MSVEERCSVCKADISERTAFACNECWEYGELGLLCTYCASEHESSETHEVEKVK